MGILLFIVALAVLAFGAYNHFQAKRILAAPFKKTGELLKDPTSPDAKGAISTEGKMVAPAQALLAPCSATPCAYYEVKIERLFEKTETTQDGTKTVKGSETLETLKNGAVIGLDDGSGAFNVDLSKGADFDAMKEGFKKEVAGHSRIPSLTFGNFVYSVKPISEKDSWTIGFKVTEKYVPVEGSLFVLGKLEGNSIVKPGWRSMMASSKGREGLLGSVSKRKKFSFIGGGVTAVAAIALMAFGPKGSTSLESSDACHFDIAGVQSVCHDSVSSKDGHTYQWVVAKAGTYELEVTPPTNKKITLDPQILVKTADGETLVEQDVNGEHFKATASITVDPGTYTVIVKDASGYMVKGGFNYDFAIRNVSTAQEPAADVADAEEPGLDLTEPAAEVKAEAKPLPAAKKIAAPVANHPVVKQVAVAPVAKPAAPAAKAAAKPAAPVKSKAMQPRRSSTKNLQD